MNEKATFRELFQSARDTFPYLVEGAIISFTEKVATRMQSLGIARTALASSLGTSPAYVTKLLRGGQNFTLESMIKVSEALNAELKIDLVPKVSIQDWAEVSAKHYPVMRSQVHVWQQTLQSRTAKDDLLGPSLFTDTASQNEVFTIAD